MKRPMTWGDVAEYLFIIIIVAAIITPFAYFEIKEHQYQEWYEALPEEEQLRIQREKEVEYNANIYTYEIISVNQYVRTNTNNFGGVVSTDICYTFTYLDEIGALKSVDDFKNLEHGLTKVTVGDTNTYIVDKNGETTRTLQLTKDTLRNIQLTQSG